MKRETRLNLALNYRCCHRERSKTAPASLSQETDAVVLFAYVEDLTTHEMRGTGGMG